ncbi:MAG: 2-C-methyl-D-erythritol 2,4-cyclodiphosphate synthase [Actinobacteria bacterium]|nr:2-C-methyl-D-erythritol 2,4-cyclodiphosphate synthase [Actinomycetota bacterium]
MKVGLGYDVHAFDPSRPLVLGGVTVEGSSGLAGWSDADVLSHAIVDAMLGAAGLGDLGAHFSTEEVPEGISSLDLIAQTAAMVSGAGYQVENVDAVVVVQDVMLSPYREEMQNRLAMALNIEASAVNVKATTTDRLGFVGAGDGAVGMAVVLLSRAPSSEEK